MADETEDKGQGAGNGEKLDKLLDHLGTISTSMQALTARMDALEGAKADAAKKDDDDKSEVEKAAAERKEDERDRSDSLAKRRADDANHVACARVQAKADTAFNAHGKRAPMPLVGETPLAYRVRMAGELRRYSPALEKVNLGAIAHADEAGFSELEDRIYADSAAEAAKPTLFVDDAIQCRTRYDRDMGREVREYYGPRTFVTEMGLPARPVLRINTPATNPGAFLR